MTRPNTFEGVRVMIDVAGPNECWLWTGRKNRDGYGVVRISGKKELAHRAAYRATFGDIPTGLSVRHCCDNPPCCNPAHLRVGTHADNMQDKILRGRQMRGETHYAAKLTDDTVRTIRAEYVRGCRNFGGAALARRFGVSDMTISEVANRKIWRHT
jgi:hypothetical protein